MLSLALGFIVIACNNDKKEHDSSEEKIEHKEHTEHDETKEHDHESDMAMAAYQCPMKCEDDKTYAEEGSCPVCKMDLKKVEIAATEESIEENE